jgi:aldehyde:ferredoxin oxidoreductase
MHKNFEKSPEKSTFSTYTNNSGNNINYVTSSTLASQILEKERKGIPEPEQWLQKQVKARAYAFAVANAVAKRNTQKGINHNDYSQYTTKFTPTNHLPFTQKQPKTSVETTTVVATKYHKDDTKRKQFVEDDAFFML